MHFHKKIPLWMQPGGHLDKKSESGFFENPIEAATREAFEETGLILNLIPDLFHVDVHETPSGHVHYDFRYFGIMEDGFPNPPIGESQKVAWFDKSNWHFITDPAIAGAIKKLKLRTIKELP